MENFLLQSLGCTLTDELEPGARQKVVAVSPAAQKVFYYQLEILKLKISVIIREKETGSLEVKDRARMAFFFLFAYHGDPATKHLQLNIFTSW